MTLPDERYRAVLRAEQFLKDLCDPSKTPRVPKDIRIRASGILRHYPGTWDMDRAATAAPEVFETRNLVEPLYKMIREYRAQDPETTNSLGEDGK
jgi:hypothetical protein